MSKLHNIGPNRYVQFMRFPVEWENKLWVRGWTQEIEEPFRTAEPLIIRLPFYRAIALGRWTGFAKDEDDALSRAIERREVTDDDFVEEKGWTPAPDGGTVEIGEKSGFVIDERLSYVSGDGTVLYWEEHSGTWREDPRSL